MYSVFDNFLGVDTVIWANFAQYPVFQARNGDEIP